MQQNLDLEIVQWFGTENSPMYFDIALVDNDIHSPSRFEDCKNECQICRIL